MRKLEHSLRTMPPISLANRSDCRVYSAYEHALLASPDPTHNVNRISIPTDIVIETLVGTGALMMAIVSNSASLRPIHWAEWAGKIEREGWDPNAPAGEEEKTLRGKGATGNPYHALEERRGFWDVRVSWPGLNHLSAI